MYLVTGAAGFIGYHLSKFLLSQGHSVVGVDSLVPYYDLNLKQARLDDLKQYPSFKFHKLDLADHKETFTQLKQYSFEYIIQLAAQPGVRYSIENPYSYNKSNYDALLTILELARAVKPKNFVFASSSSVYGKNNTVPFNEDQKIDSPVSYYAASKVAGEAMCVSYANLYNIPTVMLRFFTVYGRYGRPDMAIYSFTKNILEGKPIKLFNNGNVRRDFTYIDDIISGVVGAINYIPNGYDVFNLGNNKCEEVTTLISIIEEKLGKKAIVENAEMQMGDMVATWADVSKAQKFLNFDPKTSLKEGVSAFIDWFLNYTDISK